MIKLPNVQDPTPHSAGKYRPTPSRHHRGIQSSRMLLASAKTLETTQRPSTSQTEPQPGDDGGGMARHKRPTPSTMEQSAGLIKGVDEPTILSSVKLDQGQVKTEFAHDAPRLPRRRPGARRAGS